MLIKTLIISNMSKLQISSSQIDILRSVVKQTFLIS